MRGRRIATAAAALIGVAAMASAHAAEAPHNVIIFVADGLRSGIVTAETAPELAAVRDQGVDFQNSHALYPTITTPNASAIATGHRLGDTGDFGNVIYVGPGPLGFPVGGLIAPLEDDWVLTLLDQRYGGDYLNEESLMAAARRAGFSTAAIGKVGPTSIQDVTARDGKGTIVIDDYTGYPDVGAIPLAPDVAQAMKAAGLGLTAPDRGLNSDPGAYNMPGVHVANVEQQTWFAKAATDVVLPRFKAAGKPFVLVFWSRDPDGTQHNQGDSLNTLKPGINGPTTMAAIRNASHDLGELRAALERLGLEDTTDVIVTADHGFATISKESQTSAAAKMSFPDTPKGFLPNGFLAIDLAQALDLPIASPNGLPVALKDGFHPKGSALLGTDPAHPEVVVAANGGSDILYLPKTGMGPDGKALAERLVEVLTGEDYVAAIFVNDALGTIPGTLPMSLIGLKGAAVTPEPAIYVSYRTRAGDCAKPDTCEIEVADTELQQGQGIHGALARGDTHNFMAAIGPDFKAGFVDPAPVSNADWAVTLTQVLGLDRPAKGKAMGRVMAEALKGGAVPASGAKSVSSAPGPHGFVTQLEYQVVGDTPYFDAAGAPGRTLGVGP